MKKINFMNIFTFAREISVDFAEWTVSRKSVDKILEKIIDSLQKFSVDFAEWAGWLNIVDEDLINKYYQYRKKNRILIANTNSRQLVQVQLSSNYYMGSGNTITPTKAEGEKKDHGNFSDYQYSELLLNFYDLQIIKLITGYFDSINDINSKKITTIISMSKQLGYSGKLDLSRNNSLNSNSIDLLNQKAKMVNKLIISKINNFDEIKNSLFQTAKGFENESTLELRSYLSAYTNSLRSEWGKNYLEYLYLKCISPDLSNYMEKPMLIDTSGWSEMQIGDKLYEVKLQLNWDVTFDRARRWWDFFEYENKLKPNIILKVAEELVLRKSTIEDFYLVFIYSHTNNFQTNLKYLDYVNDKKDFKSDSEIQSLRNFFKAIDDFVDFPKHKNSFRP